MQFRTPTPIHTTVTSLSHGDLRLGLHLIQPSQQYTRLAGLVTRHKPATDTLLLHDRLLLLCHFYAVGRVDRVDYGLRPDKF